MRYVYARPDRDNWEPTVERCRKEIVALVISGGPKWATIEYAMFQKFQNVSKTYWPQFWKDVTDKDTMV
jgi:hypothetical protein